METHDSNRPLARAHGSGGSSVRVTALIMTLACVVLLILPLAFTQYLLGPANFSFCVEN